jgi:hypothetical protein
VKVAICVLLMCISAFAVGCGSDAESDEGAPDRPLHQPGDNGGHDGGSTEPGGAMGTGQRMPRACGRVPAGRPG